MQLAGFWPLSFTLRNNASNNPCATHAAFLSPTTSALLARSGNALKHRSCPSASPAHPFLLPQSVFAGQAWRCCRPAGWPRAPLGWHRPHTTSCSRSGAWPPPAAGQQQQQHNPWRRSRRTRQHHSSSKQEGSSLAGGLSWASFAQTGREHSRRGNGQILPGRTSTSSSAFCAGCLSYAGICLNHSL